jgi:hypothetical protein
MRDGEHAELHGYRLEPVAPWGIRITPYPFGERPAGFVLLRRLLAKQGPVDVLATAPERVEITIEGG